MTSIRRSLELYFSAVSDRSKLWVRGLVVAGIEKVGIEIVGVVCSKERPSPAWMIIMVDAIPFKFIVRSFYSGWMTGYIRRSAQQCSQ